MILSLTAVMTTCRGWRFSAEVEKVIRYFMTTLTVPDDEMWVNLSPYEEDRIIADGLGQTEMGRDMLAQDYLLKQLTASLMYPEEELGHEFWQKVYARAETIFGTTRIPANTFNKVWIVPQEATVYVNDNKVFLVDSHLSVMLEQDYLALEMNQDSVKHGIGDVPKSDLDVMSDAARQVVREVLLPAIEEEVNNGRTFANLRQIYHAMILATWYKQHLRSGAFGQLYIDRNKIDGIAAADKDSRRKIYEQYVAAFEKGVFNFIRADHDAATSETIPRRYFAGGLDKVQKIVPGQPSAGEIDEWAGREPAIVRTGMGMIGNNAARAALVALLVGSLCLGGGCSVSQRGQYMTELSAAMSTTALVGQPVTEASFFPVAFAMLNSPDVAESTKDRIRAATHDKLIALGYGVHPLFTRFDPAKPTVLFIHGAGGEGGAIDFLEGMQRFYQKANIVVSQYDPYEPLDENAVRLVRGWGDLMWAADIPAGHPLIVGPYSFGNGVFRSAIEHDPDGRLAQFSILEIVPLHGGSAMADLYHGSLRQRLITGALGVRNISEAQSPHGEIQAGLYDRASVANFLTRVRTKISLLIRGDRHNPSSEEAGTPFGENFQRGLAGGEVKYLEGDTSHTNAPQAPEVLDLLEEMIQDSTPPSSPAGETTNVGGIDFNPAALNLKTQGTALSFTLPSLSPQEIQAMDFTGYAPQIISVSPVTNLRLLMGME